jgi:cell wall-associated NlpC family hydrolase
VSLVAVALVMVGAVAVPGSAGASPVDDQRREVERIVDELDELHEQADILAEEYVVALDDKRRLDDEVVAAQERVAAKEAEVAQLRGELSAVAVRAFTSSGSDVLGPLFTSAGEYNDALAADQYSRVALAVGTATTDDLDEVVAELQVERAALDAKLAEADALTERIADAQVATEERLAEYEQRRAEAEAELGQLIAEEEQRRIEEAQREMAARVAAAASRPAAPAGGGDGGGDDGGDGGGGSSTNGGGDTSSGGDAGGDGGNDGGGDGGGGAPAPTYPAPSSLAQVAINAAMSQIGVPYRYATSSPGVGFDCSGLTAYAWGQAGVGLPHQSAAQAGSLPRVPVEAAQPGDLIFYYSPISHVGIYLGGGQLVHAPSTGKTVSVANVNWGKVVAVARPG